MSSQLCTWQGASAIREATLAFPKYGYPRAILFRDETASSPELLKKGRLRLLQEHGLRSHPELVNGRHALVVEGFSTSQELIRALASVGYVNAQPPQMTEIEPPVKGGVGEWINHWRHGGTLKAAGFAGIAGHALMATSGVLEKDPDKIRSAAMLAANSALYAVYGNGAGDLQYAPILKQMRTDLQKNGIVVNATPYDVAVDIKDKSRHVLRKAEDVVRTNVIEINEGIGLASQLMIMKSGWGGHDGGTRSIPFFLAGLVSAIGNGVAIFLPEVKKKDQSPELQDSLPGRIYSWLQEAPLRFLGYTTFIQNGLFFWDVAKKKSLYDAILKKESPSDPAHAQSHSQQISAKKTELMTKANEIANGTLHSVEDAERFISGSKELGLIKGQIKTLENELKVAKLGKKAWLVPLAMGSLYTTATALMTVTFKNRAETMVPEVAHGELFSRAAMTALQIPEGTERERAISLMGMSLFADKEVKNLTADEISQYIRRHVSILETSPWRDEVSPDKAPSNAVPASGDKATDTPKNVIAQPVAIADAQRKLTQELNQALVMR
jgi:hypothetical protein